MKKRKPGAATPAAKKTSRRVKQRIVLELIRKHQPISRADLARRLDLNRGIITTLVNELLAKNAIVEGHTADAPRGRRPTMLYVRSHDRLLIGVDVRFRQTSIMLSDLSGKQIALESFETRFDPAALVAELAHRIRRLEQEHIVSGVIDGIGIVVPGTVDRRTERVVFAPALGWRDVDVRAPLSEATGLPVVIENAAAACALSQLSSGRNPKPDNFVYVTISDAVGAAVVANGQLLRGATASAGAFGHIPLHPKGPRCLCGARGCWEVYASNRATLSRYVGRDRSLAATKAMLQRDELSIETLITRARAGDKRARAAIVKTGRYIGIGITNIVHSINPARIIIGGEIIEAWDMIERPIRSALRRRVFTPAAADTPITPDPATPDPRLRAAIALHTLDVAAALS